MALCRSRSRLATSFVGRFTKALSYQAVANTDLRAEIAEMIPSQQERLKQLKGKYGGVSLGDTTLEMASYGKRFLATQRFYSSHSTAKDGGETQGMEMEMVKKVGWLIKLLAAVTLTYISFNAFPIMGDSLIWQSVALLRSEDPFMKRSAASRISLIATDDKRRKNFVEAGGVKELAKMLESAADDKTRREAVKALTSLCHCDVAVEALHETGAEILISSLANGALDLDVQNQAIALLKKLDNWKQGLNQ